MRGVGLLFACLALGCGGSGSRDVVEPRDVSEAGGEPTVESVTDLGDLPALPARGGVSMDRSDGVLTVGELVLIEGEDFGKLPTVSIGDRPTQVLARTGSGGIICRVPPMVPAGKVDVEVSHPEGKHSVVASVRRYGVVVDAGAGKAYVIDVDVEGAAVVRAALELPGAADVSFSADGQAAYVLVGAAGRSSLKVISMAARGGPALAGDLPLLTEVDRLVGTPGAPVLMATGPSGADVIDTTHALTPTVAASVILPSGSQAVALSPEGDQAAVVSRGKNELILVDLRNPAQPRVRDAVPLLAEEKVPLVRDVAYSPEGREVWILAGDNAESLVAGTRPTSLITVELDSASSAPVRSVEIGGAGAPLGMVASRRETIGGATAIRSDRRRAAIVVSSADRSFVDGKSQPNAGAAGTLARVDLDGNSHVLGKGRVFSDAAIDHELRWVVATARSGDASSLYLVVSPMQGGDAREIELGKPSAVSPIARAAIALAP